MFTLYRHTAILHPGSLSRKAREKKNATVISKGEGRNPISSKPITLIHLASFPLQSNMHFSLSVLTHQHRYILQVDSWNNLKRHTQNRFLHNCKTNTQTKFQCQSCKSSRITCGVRTVLYYCEVHSTFKINLCPWKKI